MAVVGGDNIKATKASVSEKRKNRCAFHRLKKRCQAEAKHCHKRRHRSKCCCIRCCCTSRCHKKKHCPKPKPKPHKCKVVKPEVIVKNYINVPEYQKVRGKVEILGTDGNQIIPIRTDALGRLEIANPSASRMIFSEQTFLQFIVDNQLTALPVQEMATSMMSSYAVINQGDYPVMVQIEISPNSTDYAVDLQETVSPHTMKVLVPNRFLKWIRLSARTELPSTSTSLDIYYQSQTIG